MVSQLLPGWSALELYETRKIVFKLYLKVMKYERKAGSFVLINGLRLEMCWPIRLLMKGRSRLSGKNV